MIHGLADEVQSSRSRNPPVAHTHARGGLAAVAVVASGTALARPTQKSNERSDGGTDDRSGNLRFWRLRRAVPSRSTEFSYAVNSAVERVIRSSPFRSGQRLCCQNCCRRLPAMRHPLSVPYRMQACPARSSNARSLIQKVAGDADDPDAMRTLCCVGHPGICRHI